jgi:spore coat-associated protein N
MIKKRAAIAVVVLAMVAVLSSGAIYAYFNDTETSAGNSFTAGTLDLKINDVDGGLPAAFTVTDVVPGSHGYKEMKVSNTGNIGGTLTAQPSGIVDNAGVTPEPEPIPDNGELSAVMQITIFIDTNNNGVRDASEVQYYSGPLKTVSGTWNMGNLAAANDPDNKDEIEVTVAYDIPTTVGNEIMGDTCTFNIVYTLEQTH